jgi:putative ABC transport system permease protein
VGAAQAAARVTAVQPAAAYNGGMFFFTYLARELRRRRRQAIFIALGLAVGVGLVVTVTAASTGVQNAQAGVLKGLYGVGTDITVTKPPPAFNPSSSQGTRVTFGPGGAEVCNNGKCTNGAQTIDNLTGDASGALSDATVADIGKLAGVTAVTGGLSLTDRQMTIPADIGSPGSTLPQPVSFTVQGTDIATQTKLGPLSDATLTSGRRFSTADADADVAVVDANYATANNLKVGKTITIAKTKFTIIGLVSQPQASTPPDVYIPLARAQALGTLGGKSMTGEVNTIYVTTSSASDVSAVQHEIAALLPSATITTPSSLASQITGSLSSTAKLANDLGKWLSILVLITAFSLAIILTMGAVSRRVREFGTLKALGWRGRRIIAQVMAESLVMGLLGAGVGVGLGFAGAAIINAVAPSLSATLTESTGEHLVTPAGTESPTVSHTVPVPLSASVSVAAILAAVLLALAGGLLAGSFGSWRISRLRPADALTRVE